MKLSPYIITDLLLERFFCVKRDCYKLRLVMESIVMELLVFILKNIYLHTKDNCNNIYHERKIKQFS